jgi:hypothetical protein
MDKMTNEVLNNIEENAKDMVGKHTFTKGWLNVVLSLTKEIRKLRKDKKNG